MRLPRVRLTLGRLMVAVAVVGSLLGLCVNAPFVASLLLTALIFTGPTTIVFAILVYQESVAAEADTAEI